MTENFENVLQDPFVFRSNYFPPFHWTVLDPDFHLQWWQICTWWIDKKSSRRDIYYIRSWKFHPSKSKRWFDAVFWGSICFESGKCFDTKLSLFWAFFEPFGEENWDWREEFWSPFWTFDAILEYFTTHFFEKNLRPNKNHSDTSKRSFWNYNYYSR